MKKRFESASYRIAWAVIGAMMLAAAGGCDRSIYVRDGVTDGDTFYVADYALTDERADVQSWVAYSLDRSTCQLTLGGPNPARNTSYECELGAREALVDTWLEQRSRKAADDAYLDMLAEVSSAGYLDEYVWQYHRRRGWRRPAGLEMDAFGAWRSGHLDHHRPQTRLVGSWNYQWR